MGRSSLALVLAAAVLAGCGADEERAVTTAAVTTTRTVAVTTAAGDYLIHPASGELTRVAAARG